jgi:hypothetical protein
MVFGDPFAGQDGDRTQYDIQYNGSSQEYQVYTGMFIPFSGKTEEWIIAFY